MLSLLVQLMDSVAVKKSQNRKWTQVVGPLSHKKHAGLLPTPRRHVSGRALVTRECSVELVAGMVTVALRCGAPEWGQRPPITGIIPAVSHTSLLLSLTLAFCGRVCPLHLHKGKESGLGSRSGERGGGGGMETEWDLGIRARVDVTFTGVV